MKCCCNPIPNSKTLILFCDESLYNIMVVLILCSYFSDRFLLPPPSSHHQIKVYNMCSILITPPISMLWSPKDVFCNGFWYQMLTLFENLAWWHNLNCIFTLIIETKVITTSQSCLTFRLKLPAVWTTTESELKLSLVLFQADQALVNMLVLVDTISNAVNLHAQHCKSCTHNQPITY